MRQPAEGTAKMLYPMRETFTPVEGGVRVRATIGEVHHTLRNVCGVFKPTERLAAGAASAGRYCLTSKLCRNVVHAASG